MSLLRLPCVLLLFAALAQACAGDKTKGLPDGGAGDAGSVEAEPRCASTLATDKTVDIDTMGKDQLQASVAFDGAVWVAYDQADADGSGGFDIWATRLACDGSVLSAPFRVNTATKTNDLNPVIAARNGRVLIAWLTDDGSTPNNLTIRYRLYGSDGTPVLAEERTLATNRAGLPVAVNAWQASVAALPEGFAIAGTRAPLLMGGFQAFVQRIDGMGVPVGATIDAPAETGIEHSDTALASSPDGTLFWAWGRQRDVTDLAVMHAKIVPGGSTAQPNPPVEATSGRTGSYPAMATGWGAQPTTYLAFGSQLESLSTILVTDATSFDLSAPPMELGPSTANSFAPTIAPATGGGAVAWFIQPQGARELMVQGFGYDGKKWTPGISQTISAPLPSEVAPAPPGFVHLSGKTYFLGWGQGTSPGYVLKGRFLTLD